MSRTSANREACTKLMGLYVMIFSEPCNGEVLPEVEYAMVHAEEVVVVSILAERV